MTRNFTQGFLMVMVYGMADSSVATVAPIDDLATKVQAVIAEFQTIQKEPVISEETKNELSLLWPYDEFKAVLHEARVQAALLGQLKVQVDLVLHEVDLVEDYTFRFWWFTQDRFTLFTLFDELLEDLDLRDRTSRDVITQMYGNFLARGILAQYVQGAIAGKKIRLDPYLQRFALFRSSGPDELRENNYLVEFDKVLARFDTLFSSSVFPLLEKLSSEDLLMYQKYGLELALMPTAFDARSDEEKSDAFKDLESGVMSFQNQLKANPELTGLVCDDIPLVLIMKSLQGEYVVQIRQAATTIRGI